MPGILSRINDARRELRCEPLEVSPYLTNIAERRMHRTPEIAFANHLYSDNPGVFSTDEYDVHEMGDIMVRLELSAFGDPDKYELITEESLLSTIYMGLENAIDAQWLKLMNPEQKAVGIAVSNITGAKLYVEVISYTHV